MLLSKSVKMYGKYSVYQESTCFWRTQNPSRCSEKYWLKNTVCEAAYHAVSCTVLLLRRSWVETVFWLHCSGRPMEFRIALPYLMYFRPLQNTNCFSAFCKVKNFLASSIFKGACLDTKSSVSCVLCKGRPFVCRRNEQPFASEVQLQNTWLYSVCSLSNR